MAFMVEGVQTLQAVGGKAVETSLSSIVSLVFNVTKCQGHITWCVPADLVGTLLLMLLVAIKRVQNSGEMRLASGHLTDCNMEGSLSG